MQLCGGDGGAVVVGMMSMAFPGGEEEREFAKNNKIVIVHKKTLDELWLSQREKHSGGR